MSSEEDVNTGVATPQARPGKPGGKRDKNRKERIRVIQEAALVLFLEQGLAATTIDEITKSAGTAKGNFYRYFSDKEDLVRAIMRPVTQKVESDLTRAVQAIEVSRDRATMIEAYEELGRQLAVLLGSYALVLKLYLQESRGARSGARAPICELSELVSTKAIEMTRKAHENNLLRPFQAEISALAVVGAGERLLTAVLEGENVGDPLLLPMSVTSLILDGLRHPESTDNYARDY
jgi:AcrR family transcriptional regulator